MMWNMTICGHYPMALLITVSLSCYLRPGEAFGLHVEDVLSPCHGGNETTSIIICPGERQAMTKVGDKDNTVILDTVWMTWLPSALLTYVATLRRNVGRLFEFNYLEFLSVFRSTCSNLGIKRLVPYQWRHSGASIDRIKKARTQQEVMRRGFGRSTRSLLRYEKSGRLSVSYKRHTLEQQLFFEKVEQRIAMVMLGEPHGLPDCVPYPVS